MSLFTRKPKHEKVSVVTSSGRTVVNTDALLQDAGVRRFLNRVDARIESVRKRDRNPREATVATR
jgi:hypothetical protein